MGKARARTGVICAAPFCLSACFPGCGIRFHPFPNNVLMRNKWLNILKMSPDDYKEDMMICNSHFNNSDHLNNSKRGKLKDGAFPHFCKKEKPSESNDLGVNSFDIEQALEQLEQVSDSSDFDSNNDSDEVLDFPSDDERTGKETIKKKQKPAKLKPKDAKNKTKTDILPVDKIINEIFEENDTEDQDLCEDPHFTEPYHVLTHVCRICLATGCAMYSMNEYNLEPSYLLLTGIKSDMFDETKMPQMLCFECVQRLQNFIQFSTKSLTAWSVLKELIEEDKLSMDEIKAIDREKNMLSSKLSYTVFEPNYCNLELQECDEEEIKVFTNKYHSESMLKFEVNNEDHNQSMEISFIDAETHLEMNVDSKDNAFITDKKEFEDHDNSCHENRLPIKNEYPDKNENPNENVYTSENMFPCDKDVPSDSEDDFFNSNENVTENNCRSKNAEDDSGEDLPYNYRYKKKVRKDELDEFFEKKSLTTDMQKAVLESRKNTQTYKNSAFKCDKCFRAFNFEETYKEHMKRHTIEYGEFVCPVCQAHFFTRYRLMNHVRNLHAKSYQCRLCPFKTTGKSFAVCHKLSHDGKRYQCKKCPKSFMKPTPFYNHMTRYHPEDAVCHLCGESHAGFQNLDRHMRTAHRGEDLKLPPLKKLNALYEKESVRRKETASAHTLVYFVTTLPDDAPSCDQCEIRFLDKTAIQRHFSVSPLHGNTPKTPNQKKLHTNKKTVKVICEQCGVEFSGHLKYATHFLSEHPGLNRTQYPGNFMCELCGKVLQSKTVLNEHLKMHADVSTPNILVCNICGAERSTKSGLLIHMRDHRLTHKCEICNRVFASQSGLVKHSKIHTFKPYACEKCSKRFCTPSEKKTHITHTHMGVPWPKKRPKGSAPLRRRGGKVRYYSHRSVVDMKQTEQFAEQRSATEEAEEE